MADVTSSLNLAGISLELASLIAAVVALPASREARSWLVTKAIHRFDWITNLLILTLSPLIIIGATIILLWVLTRAGASLILSLDVIPAPRNAPGMYVLTLILCLSYISLGVYSNRQEAADLKGKEPRWFREFVLSVPPKWFSLRQCGLCYLMLAWTAVAVVVVTEGVSAPVVAATIVASLCSTFWMLPLLRKEVDKQTRSALAGSSNSWIVATSDTAHRILGRVADVLIAAAILLLLARLTLIAKAPWDMFPFPHDNVFSVSVLILASLISYLSIGEFLERRAAVRPEAWVSALPRVSKMQWFKNLIASAPQVARRHSIGKGLIFYSLPIWVLTIGAIVVDGINRPTAVAMGLASFITVLWGLGALIEEVDLLSEAQLRRVVSTLAVVFGFGLLLELIAASLR